MSGRGGWKTQRYNPPWERELNDGERTLFEDYQGFCQRVCGYPGAPDYIWYVVSQSIPSH